LTYLVVRGITIPMSHARNDSAFLNGVPEFLLLRLLEREPMYGYQLVQQIRLCSGGVLSFGEGCIYPTLHRMEAERWITSKATVIEGRKRVVYHITATGRKRLVASQARWQEIRVAVDQFFEGAADGAAGLA
jgi:PadR family transcriptional regulator, regulatory protein PadR